MSINEFLKNDKQHKERIFQWLLIKDLKKIKRKGFEMCFVTNSGERNTPEIQKFRRNYIK